MTPDDRNTLIDAISKESDGGSSPTDVMSSATVPNDSASLKQHAASGQRVNPASIKTTSSMQAWAAAVQAETKVRRLLDDNARQDESQAKATEGKAGNAEGTPLVRQTTTGTGLRVGAADAVQPATSEFMDVTAGETAPSSDYDHGYADGVEWATKKYAPGTSDSAPNHQPHAVSQAAAFVAWAMREGPWEGGDLDGGALQDKAEELGLIIKTTYNPDIHGSCDYGSEPGDDWFVLHPDIEAAARLRSSEPTSTAAPSSVEER